MLDCESLAGRYARQLYVSELQLRHKEFLDRNDNGSHVEDRCRHCEVDSVVRS